MNHVALAIVRRRGLRFVPEPLDHLSMCREDALDAALSPGQPVRVHRPGALRRFPAAAALDRGGCDR